MASRKRPVWVPRDILVLDRSVRVEQVLSCDSSYYVATHACDPSAVICVVPHRDREAAKASMVACGYFAAAAFAD